MSDRGQLHGEGPTACPFVAFDDDRDRRSVEPDHRHRCYAEERPAPRALAHQSAYCLTGSFPACPTFVDWARRETAAAVPAPIVPPLPSPVLDDDEDSFVDDLPPRHPRRRDWASPPRWMAEASGGQLRAFDEEAGPTDQAGPAEEVGPVDEAGPPMPERRSRPARPPEPVEPDAADEASSEPLPRRQVHRASPGAASRDDEMRYARRPAEDEPLEGAPPDFLADRAARAPMPTESGRPAGPGPTRFRSRDPRDRRREDEDVYESAGQARRFQPRERRRPGSLRDTPSWESPRHYEAYPTLRTRVGLPRLPPLAIAVVAVLIAAALLFALPSIFGGGGTGPASPTPTPRSSASAGGSVAPTGPASPTPQTYVVRPGDTLIRIADQYGLTVDQMMVANPQLQDPDSIRVDDVLTIPPPGSPGSSPSRSPSAAP
jgi:nucleoid-associated protein YgaU